jgi:hypothetical protein
MSDEEPSDGTESAVTSGDGDLADELARARELLDREDLDGVYVATVSGDEYDYVFGHRGGDPEQVGMQAMGLLAQHLGAMVEQTGQPPAQVAGDAAMLARTLGVTSEQSLADIEADIEGTPDVVPGAGTDEPADDEGSTVEEGAGSNDDGAGDAN